jgi:mono/diheme cytochrome c family protein
MRKHIVAFFAGLALLPAAAIIAARLGLWPSQATSSPPQWERVLAQSALQSSVARRARGITNPIGRSNDTLLAGMKIYRMNCAGCHGEFQQPSHWGTTGFYPRVPQFAEAPSPLSPPEMFVVVKDGIRYTGMGAWDGMLSDDEIWKAVMFLSRVQSLPEPVAAAWRAKP